MVASIGNPDRRRVFHCRRRGHAGSRSPSLCAESGGRKTSRHPIVLDGCRTKLGPSLPGPRREVREGAPRAASSGPLDVPSPVPGLGHASSDEVATRRDRASRCDIRGRRFVARSSVGDEAVDGLAGVVLEGRIGQVGEDVRLVDHGTIQLADRARVEHATREFQVNGTVDDPPRAHFEFVRAWKNTVWLTDSPCSPKSVR